MSNVNPSPNDRTRYWLQHNSYPKLLVDESEISGWNEDDKEYARNDDYDGIFAKFSNNLTFYDTPRDFINLVKTLHGINASIRLIKEVKNQEMQWVVAYSGRLDLAEWGTENNGLTCKFNSSELYKTLEARRKDKIEIERLTDIAGNTIPFLETDTLALDGRRIQLSTTFEVVEAVTNSAKVDVASNAGNTREDTVNVPLSLVTQSHDYAHSTIVQTDGSNDNGSTGMMFYAVNDRDRTLEINLDFDFDVRFQQFENVQWCRYQVCLTTYENGVSYDVKDRKVLCELRSAGNGASSNLYPGASSTPELPGDLNYPLLEFIKHVSGSFSGSIDLLANESLALEIRLSSDMFVDINAGVRAYAQNMAGNVSLSIDEDSEYPATKTEGVMAYEYFERILRIITSRDNAFKSTVLDRIERGADEDGKAAMTFNSHGMWNRRFSSDDELYKPLATSFEEAFESYSAAYCLGLGIESIGNTEKIVIEDKKYFWNPNVAIRLGKMNEETGMFEYTQVSNVKRSVAKDKYYSSAIFGSEKGGDYDGDVTGLQETNTQANFITTIEAITNEYKQLAKYRLDPYGQEGERRRGIDTYPDSDRSADLHIWMNHVKASVSGGYEHVRWEDVLESSPINMFDPDSSYNFIFSPVQMLLEHDWMLNAGLQEYPDDYVVFGSSTGKSTVIQHRAGRLPYSENGVDGDDGTVYRIKNSDLSRARFKPEEIEFEYEVDLDVINQIEGSSTFFGKTIPNLYGLVEFLNEFGELEKGFLLNLKPNGSGKWVLLKFNR